MNSNHLIVLVEAYLAEINDKAEEERRTRSDCTYEQADLALHSPRNKSLVVTDMIRVKVDI